MKKPAEQHETAEATESIETIAFAGGCFWCVEAVFTALRGVVAAESGYANGNSDSVSYEEVCTGQSGFAEVVRLRFDTAVIPLTVLLDVFFATHDPTALNRQGNDVGTQYRSGIYTETAEQLQQVQAYMQGLAQRVLAAGGAAVVTEVLPLRNYVTAEAYHQRFFEKNPDQPYCVYTAVPKLEKLAAGFGQWLKPQQRAD